MARPGRPDLTRAQQYLFLKSSGLTDGTGLLKDGCLTWQYKVRPTPLSREYTVQIEYRRKHYPRVFINDPDIEALAGTRSLPHVYKNPLRLCLYLPGSDEWDGSMRIDKTFVPWAAVWLFYFEEWLLSDCWKGGGIHPDEQPYVAESRRDRRSLETASQ